MPMKVSSTSLCVQPSSWMPTLADPAPAISASSVLSSYVPPVPWPYITKR
jgi:hypothetical protein